MKKGKGIVGERGQVTIPKAIRERFGWSKGSQLEFEVTPNGLTLRGRRPDSDPVWKVFGRLNKGVDTDQFIGELRDE